MIVTYGVIRKQKWTPGYMWLETMRLGSGYAAVLMWCNGDDAKLGVFSEPYQTGIGRYATREEAIAEVKQWAEAEEIDYIEDEPS